MDPSKTLREKLTASLKSGGYSLTKARLEIALTLEHSGKSSVAEIASALDGVVNRSSVYRGLEVLEGIGVVQRVQIGWKTQFELSHEFTDHHHHLICIKCQSVVDIAPDEAIESGISKLAAVHDYRLVTHSLELRGLCSDCQ